MPKVKEKNIAEKCYHCGEDCKNSGITSEEKSFCCEGCKAVYEILKGNDLCSYYTDYNKDEKYPTKLSVIKFENKFEYLNDTDIQKKLLDFKDNKISKVTFIIPSIHCSSCIWLLEKLFKLNSGIKSSVVDFPKKSITIIFDHSAISLKDVVVLISSIGYEPLISPEKNDDQIKRDEFKNKDLTLKIGIAGFCLGNIMLLSFPEYLSNGGEIDSQLKNIFNYLNILLSLPVFFYSASDYFISAWKAVKKNYINIDFPISLGLIALFVRSLYEIILFNNSGYIDSLAGLIFLLLIGKLFQSKTYQTLNFERDYKSYFPVSVTVLKNGNEISIPVAKLETGERILIRNGEIIPADSILFNGNANIDYSFVTGESMPEQKVMGEIIYAGGRHFGSAIELEVIKTVSQSYLTQLWNNDAFKKTQKSNIQNLTDKVSKYFTVIILAIAFGSGLFWIREDINKAIDAFTTVLIIACPCAFALTTPFAFGYTLRIFGRNKFYLKKGSVIEDMSNINTVVFDKTGTITDSGNISVKFFGSKLSHTELCLVKTLVRNSSHPLSRKIFESISSEDCSDDLEVTNFDESISDGISGIVSGIPVKVGNIKYLLKDLDCSYYESGHEFIKKPFSTNVFISINNFIKGYYSFRNIYRAGIDKAADELSEDYELAVITGDNNSEMNNLIKIFGSRAKLLFNQKPQDKLNYVKEIQSVSGKVLMIGDGLNDAGALKQSEVGISVSENITNFLPSCDAIIDADEISKIGKFIRFSKTTINIIRASFVISFVYNIIGLYLAAQGIFSPLVAAILMPFNSISIIVIIFLLTNFFAKRRGLA
ncbi:MAG TPA: heavy metal translocating P-type ATPase metal-binding domain-containing protein [Ignavibacteria bacterium]|nr:heavy metal translocating P-type ATPase [Bacteroidota bacterium]HRI84184.1 heavy metal translocating P-type ATPase metal-binding domain-containing protein [Ignavibacteria bacterium]HRJ97978.1 heavy metal translocating P-type ATPase metal-binding domain-containing protein [Ignavibacteria bacterium]